MMDKVFSFEDLKVFVDATSLMYLNGCTVDYVETLEAAGFKFDNPQVKSTCGCGSSFSRLTAPIRGQRSEPVYLSGKARPFEGSGPFYASEFFTVTTNPGAPCPAIGTYRIFGMGVDRKHALKRHFSQMSLLQN